MRHISLDALAERTAKGIQALALRQNAQRIADNAAAALAAAAARRAAGVVAVAWDELSESDARDMQRLARSERSRAEQLLRAAYDDVLNAAQVQAAPSDRPRSLPL